MIGTRFEQEDFKIYVNIQEILLKSFANERCGTKLTQEPMSRITQLHYISVTAFS